MIPYKWTLRDHLGHDAATDLARIVESIDVSGSSSYSGSSYPQLPAVCDPYGPYGASKTSSSNYYPMQPGASYGSDFTSGIFGWVPVQSYHQFLDTSHNQDLSEGSAMSYNALRIPPGISLQEYHSAWLEVIQDVDLQKVPVRFAITSAGLVGSDGPSQCGAFDVTFMACLPNMIVMAPSNGDELIDMVVTAARIEDRPVCFRYPRGAVVGISGPLYRATPLEIGKGEVLVEGKDVAILGYGSVIPNCLKAQFLLAGIGVHVTVANARFCKPLDLELIRRLCKEHEFLITVEEGTIGGFGSHVSQFMALDGLLDGRTKWRPIILPDKHIEHASLKEQLEIAGLTGHHIAATALSLLGRHRDALLLMR